MKDPADITITYSTHISHMRGPVHALALLLPPTRTSEDHMMKQTEYLLIKELSYCGIDPRSEIRTYPVHVIPIQKGGIPSGPARLRGNKERNNVENDKREREILGKGGRVEERGRRGRRTEEGEGACPTLPNSLLWIVSTQTEQ